MPLGKKKNSVYPILMTAFAIKNRRRGPFACKIQTSLINKTCLVTYLEVDPINTNT